MKIIASIIGSYIASFRNASLESRACVFAYWKFLGLRHRDGSPAFNHSYRVGDAFRGEPELMAIGYLHDLIEDTDVTEQEVRIRFGDRVADAVVALTRLGDESWNHYMRKVHGNPDAVRVKIVDIKDNLARMDEKMASGSRGGAMYYEALERLTALAA